MKRLFLCFLLFFLLFSVLPLCGLLAPDEEADVVRETALALPKPLEAEAVKAHAVAVRTKIRSGAAAPDSSEEDAVLRFGAVEYERIRRLCRQTEGEILTTDENPIIPVWHLVNSGQTESAANISYLASVPSPWDTESVYAETERSYTGEELELLLKSGLPDWKPGTTVSGLVRTASGRVRQATVGNRTVSGKELQQILQLPSDCFLLFPASDGGVRILCRGIGDGLGMSQIGADFMAKRGYSYQEILTYYYTDVHIAQTVRSQ